MKQSHDMEAQLIHNPLVQDLIAGHDNALLFMLSLLDDDKSLAVEWADAISESSGRPFVDIAAIEIDTFLVRRVSVPVIMETGAFPVYMRGGVIYVATAHPLDQNALDRVSSACNTPVSPLVADALSLRAVIDSISKSDHSPTPDRHIEPHASTLKCIDILHQGLESGASHVEIRLTQTAAADARIDGVVAQLFTSEQYDTAHFYDGLPLFEESQNKNLHFQYDYLGASFDINIQRTTDGNGDVLLLRIDNKSLIHQALCDLGLSVKDEEAFLDMLSASSGIILLFGPRHSGKTLLALLALLEIKSQGRSILSYELDHGLKTDLFTQVQGADKDHSLQLRSLISQDYDAVAIDGIKNTELAQLAIESAVAGKLVIATIYAESASSAIKKLRALGLPKSQLKPFLIGGVECHLLKDSSTPPYASNSLVSGLNNRLRPFKFPYSSASLLAPKIDLSQQISIFKDAVEKKVILRDRLPELYKDKV